MKRKESDLNYCEKDYHNRHCFQRVGVDKGYIIYRCSQCEKCFRRKIVYVKGGE